MNAEEAVRHIFTAVFGGHVEEVARLLDANPHLMEAREEEEHRTPLLVAAIYGRTDVVRLLLERGADINAGDDSDITALQYAAEEGHEEVVSILLSCGADSSRRGSSGLTALILSSFSGRLDVVQHLLQHMAGRGLDERNHNGRTALWGACLNNHVEVARFLLLAGADPTIADTDEETPRQAAARYGRPACVSLLEVSGTCSGRLRGHAFEKPMQQEMVSSFCVHTRIIGQQD
jgi:ankyrin repeat protein